MECGLIDSITPKKFESQLEIVEIDLENKPEWYIGDINPNGKVPSMEITTSEGKKRILIESSPITYFVMEAWSPSHSSSLKYPMDPVQQYDARRFVEQFESTFIPTFYKLLREKDASKQIDIKADFLSILKNINGMLANGKKYAIADQISIADILTAPFVLRLPGTCLQFQLLTRVILYVIL
jgi:glutathione S-transferase